MRIANKLAAARVLAAATVAFAPQVAALRLFEANRLSVMAPIAQ